MSATEFWRLRRRELRKILETFEQQVAADYQPFETPSRLERHLLGDDALRERADSAKRACARNRAFVESMIADLPGEAGDWQTPSRPAMEMRWLETAPTYLPKAMYGSLGLLFLHLSRDWSDLTERVLTSTYRPALAELRAALVPVGAHVLVPGAGVCRLAAEAAASGYIVEANEGSRLFCTAADYVLNRAPAGPDRQTFFPMSHFFEHNWNLAGQYLEVGIPMPNPRDMLTGRQFTLVPGDFSELYAPGGPSYRKFDAILTCFFLDSLLDLADFIGMLECLLDAGGVWVNVGPLHFDKAAKLKLSWEEIAIMISRAGFDFKTQREVECDYFYPKGVRMRSEGYSCILSVAVKRAGGPGSPPSASLSGSFAEQTPKCANFEGPVSPSLPSREGGNHQGACWCQECLVTAEGSAVDKGEKLDDDKQEQIGEVIRDGLRAEDPEDSPDEAVVWCSPRRKLSPEFV